MRVSCALLTFALATACASCGSAIHQRTQEPLVQGTFTQGTRTRSIESLQPSDVDSGRPIAILVDEKPYGLTLVVPANGSMEPNIWITAPGFPFPHGRVELTIFRKADRSPVFTESVSYRPIGEVSELLFKLPQDLAQDEYIAQAALILYGDVKDINSGEIERVREAAFVHGAPSPPPQVALHIIDGYNIDQILPSTAQLRSLTDHLKELKSSSRIDLETIVIEGYTCDVGTRRVNEGVSLARAQAIKDALKHFAPNVDDRRMKTIPMSSSNPVVTVPNDASAAEKEAARSKNRRVRIRVEYHLRP